MQPEEVVDCSGLGMTLHAHVPTYSLAVLQFCCPQAVFYVASCHAVLLSGTTMAQQCKILFGCCASPAGGWGPGILQDCMTGQSTWVCSGQRLFRLKFANSGLRNMALTFLELFWVQVHDSISLGRTPELLVLGLRVCVGLGSRDRSVGFRA